MMSWWWDPWEILGPLFCGRLPHSKTFGRRITIPQLMVSGLQFEAQKLHQMKSQWNWRIKIGRFNKTKWQAKKIDPSLHPWHRVKPRPSYGGNLKAFLHHIAGNLLCSWLCRPVNSPNSSKKANLYIYVCVYVCMYVCMYIYKCLLPSMYVCMYVCMYVYAQTSRFAHTLLVLGRSTKVLGNMKVPPPQTVYSFYIHWRSSIRV